MARQPLFNRLTQNIPPKTEEREIYNMPTEDRTWPHPEPSIEEQFVEREPPVKAQGIDIMTLDMQHLVGKIQELSRIGIEDNQIALPKICVVGDQSTGKSSLIEGISEIQVPRSAGTCTRCPMEINLSESKPGDPWKCIVYLSRRYVYDPLNKLKTSKRTQLLGPWVACVGRDEEVFMTLYDRSEVQETIKWAQVAILNPADDSNIYKPGMNRGVTEKTAVKFSPNVVRLDISGPKFPALSFYDLPGVISQPEHDDEKYLVRLVENLVKHYVSQENCIILLTLTMTDDATNSSAARLIRDIKNAKERTLGVLTKPDRALGMESFEQWREILAGQKFKLGHGYFVVRNNQNPGVDHARARKEEERFFDDPFWKGTMSEYRDRLGVRRLQEALKEILMAQIRMCLPSIIDQINEKARRVNRELADLPSPPTENRQYIVMEKVLALRSRLNEILIGSSEVHDTPKMFLGFSNRLATDFQTALKITKPTVMGVIVTDTESKGNQNVNGSPQAGRLKRKHESSDMTPPDSPTPAPPTKLYLIDGIFDKYVEAARRFHPREIREFREESGSTGIPNHIDPTVIESLNRASIKHWSELASVFVSATCTIVLKIITKCLDEVIAQYRQTGLYRELSRVISEFINECQVEFMGHARAQFRIEYDKPFTMAQARHKAASKSALQLLTSGRNRARARAIIRQAGGDVDDESKIVKFMKDLGIDDFVQEIEMMADSHGYYEIASSRFLDVICQSAHAKVISKCRTHLVDVINDRLNTKSADQCNALMAEDPERERRRGELIREREKLSRAQDWIQTIHHTDDMDTVSDCFAPI
ncbi:Uncharacterized protein PECH_004168 [Penicillium ucsense]|uniref:GED domain-containing protein n=1 Tax=Penicillium ucsense TaxID=2839758 RepID=A0A8J8WK75_9EURO|nr:Uncharacterized protein PECM_005575 [Penicillium ucsense]KAF7737250.1 Uncharacterized protein PECH_004168 [Penicillium ucsense]